MTVQDFLAVGPVEDQARRPDYHRAPTDTGAIGALIRIATCISGHVEVAVNCAPLFNYGTTSGTWSYQGDGYDAMTVAPAEGDLRLELAGSIRLGVMGARGYGRTTLTEGQSAHMVLSWGDARRPSSRRRSAGNRRFWRDWLSGQIPDHPWKPYIDAARSPSRRSATPRRDRAAATTSLPIGRGATGTPVHLDRDSAFFSLAVPAWLRLGGDRVFGSSSMLSAVTSTRIRLQIMASAGAT
jgi:hypothetical protein